LLAGDAANVILAEPPADRFNPRPPLLAGDAPFQRNLPGHFRGFNPRPPLLAGDAVARGPRWEAAWRFNPRPPLLAGDARSGQGAAVRPPVSIRARHCWRAMRFTCMLLLQQQFFLRLRDSSIAG